MASFDARQYLGLDDREFEELRSLPPGQPWWRLLLWLAYVKRRRFVRGLFWIVVAVAGTTTIWTAFLAVVEPWNHSFYLWPTLTGEWTGEFSAPGGRQLLHLDINGDRENPPIAGTATTCDARGALRSFSIDGGPRNWRGTRFWLTTGRRDEFDDEGVQFVKVDGEWGRDTMHVTGTLEPFKQVRGASISSTADPPLPEPVVHFTLQRAPAREFVTACAHLRRSP